MGRGFFFFFHLVFFLGGGGRGGRVVEGGGRKGRTGSLILIHYSFPHQFNPTFFFVVWTHTTCTTYLSYSGSSLLFLDLLSVASWYTYLIHWAYGYLLLSVRGIVYFLSIIIIIFILRLFGGPGGRGKGGGGRGGGRIRYIRDMIDIW